jgi:hypothetical protein
MPCVVTRYARRTEIKDNTALLTFYITHPNQLPILPAAWILSTILSLELPTILLGELLHTYLDENLVAYIDAELLYPCMDAIGTNLALYIYLLTYRVEPMCALGAKVNKI